MKILRVLAVLLLAAGASAQTKVIGGGGGGSSIITSGTTDTSGCIAGGVLRSISNQVECGAGLTYASGVGLDVSTNITITGVANALTLTDAYAQFSGGLIGVASRLVTGGQGSAWSTNDLALRGTRLFFASGATAYGMMDSTGAWSFGGGTGVPVTINNGSAAVSPLVVQDNGTDKFWIADGGAARMESVSLSDGDGGGIFTNPSGGWTWITDGDNHNRFFMPYTAASSTINNNFRLEGHKHANTSTGYGTGLLFQGRSTTTADNDMIRVAGVWTDATHASRSAAVVFEAVNGAAALAEVGRFNAVGGLKIATGTKPTCDATYRGTLYYVAGGAGVADTYEACRKDAADAYAWTAIY